MNDTHQEQLAALRHKIEAVRFGMLTTIDPERSLSSRPMTSQQIDAQGRLWFFTSDESGFARHLTVEPTVNVTFSDPDGSLYISVSGRAMLTKDRAKTEELWNPMVGAWFPEGIDDPHLALISVDIHAAEYWDSASSKMTQLVAIAKGLLTGTRPNDAGEHVTLKL